MERALRANEILDEIDRRRRARGRRRAVVAAPVGRGEEGSSSSHLQEEHTQDVGAHLEDKQEQPNNEQLLPSESRASVETEESEESEEEDKVWREGDNDDFTISLEEI